ncbi:rhomboid family intramembrane serine protease [Ruminococcaceae bacterium OttesenSCG-928-A16]|nr:rhomboid family intramembrane serine protease [Ruminococcaceae bacterium OttesenSCG-928-A16]
MKWLYKLDYKYGRHYIRNLMRIIVVGMAMVYIAGYVMPEYNLASYLSLNRSAILSGQVWRLITFIFVPEQTSPIWIFISLYFYYFIGTSLESVWGGFRFNLYYLAGILGSILACFISPAGYADNTYLNLSLFLAYATLAPDATFQLFFLISVKAKWLAIFYVVFAGLTIAVSFRSGLFFGLSALVTFGFSLLGYLLFFGPTLLGIIKEQIRIAKNRRNWRNNSR